MTVLSDALGNSLETVQHSLERLAHAGLVRIATDSVVAEPPEFALSQLVEAEAQRLRDAEQALVNARNAIAEFRAEQRLGSDRQPAGGLELVPTVDLPRTILGLIPSTTGEMLFLRPDQWLVAGADEYDRALIDEMERGRPSRAIYPHHALDEAADSIRARARAGELVRVLPEVPSRLAILDDQAAVMADEWGDHGGNRLLVRHQGIIGALRQLFDELWRRATAVPGMCAEATDAQRQLLGMLASGAIDEQMARTLGVSLRTVRRHIAALMTELGAASRFQLGAEAVRRGWL